MPSPIERMIDAATGYKPPEPPKKRTLPTAEEREIATEAGNEVIWHIDRMYPAMWDGVPKSARTSIKNTVHNRVLSILLNVKDEPRRDLARAMRSMDRDKSRRWLAPCSAFSFLALEHICTRIPSTGKRHSIESEKA